VLVVVAKQSEVKPKTSISPVIYTG
jgi:hypothetical protein